MPDARGGHSPKVRPVRYDLLLILGRNQRRVELETETQLRLGDQFPYELRLYAVIGVRPGSEGFDAMVLAVPADPEMAEDIAT